MLGQKYLRYRYRYLGLVKKNFDTDTNTSAKWKTISILVKILLLSEKQFRYWYWYLASIPWKRFRYLWFLNRIFRYLSYVCICSACNCGEWFHCIEWPAESGTRTHASEKIAGPHLSRASALSPCSACFIMEIWTASEMNPNMTEFWQRWWTTNN